MTEARDFRVVLAGLLIAAAFLFAIGVALESSAESDEPGHAEMEGTHHMGEATEGHHELHADEDESLFGLDLESPLAVAVGILLSVVLAVLALRPPNRTVLIVIALFALGFAILDGREFFHQLDEDRIGLAALAGLVALLHLAAATIAGRESARSL